MTRLLMLFMKLQMKFYVLKTTFDWLFNEDEHTPDNYK